MPALCGTKNTEPSYSENCGFDSRCFFLYFCVMIVKLYGLLQVF